VTLEELRTELRQVDNRIAELIAERLRLAEDVGREKERLGLPIRDYATEKRVHEFMRAHAKRMEIDPSLIAEVTSSLIQGAVRRQAERRKPPVRDGDKTSVVIGGDGHMGQWFTGYLGSRGYGVEIIEKSDSMNPVASADLVVVSVPLDRTLAVMQQIANLKPSGIILEISSLKTPMLEHIPAWIEAGMKFAAIHPMFGAEADLLAGRNLIICQAGCRDAEEAAVDLFLESALNIVHLPLQDHDRMMTWVLNLPHLINLLTADLFVRSGVPLSKLRELGGTTFQRQEEVTEEVAGENPDLYFFIQQLNRHTPELYQMVGQALETMSEEVLSGRRDEFHSRMTGWRNWFQ
jgi:chorismate mutase/prephenate dehydrogenase